MKKFLVILLLASATVSCSSKEPESLMSPCVGKSGSPCDRIPLNQQMLGNTSLKV